jgi:hypothetical protein
MQILQQQKSAKQEKTQRLIGGKGENTTKKLFRK